MTDKLTQDSIHRPRDVPKPGPVGSPELVAENLQPLSDLVLVLRDKPEAQTGMIHIPQTAQTQKCTGVIMAVGPDVPDIIRVGDRVLVAKYPSIELEIYEEIYMLFHAYDLMCIIHDPGLEVGRTE